MKRSQYLFLSFISLGLVVFAVFLQQVGYQGVSFLPCPLCILQRAGYIGIAVACVMAASFDSISKFFHGMAIVATGFGLAVAGHHVWLLFHPGESCGVDPLELWINQFQVVQGLPWLFKADGLCSAQLPAILGLQVPEWSWVWFSGFLVVLIVTFFRKPR
jgi:disulfide bond formation protein DsbB